MKTEAGWGWLGLASWLRVGVGVGGNSSAETVNCVIKQIKTSAYFYRDREERASSILVPRLPA
jgi:hypothetical protein